MNHERTSLPVAYGHDRDPTLRSDYRGTIGLIGGMSWRSSADYYARLNILSEARCGMHANLPSIIDTLQFSTLLEAGARKDWAEVERRIVNAGMRLQNAGCTAVALTAVTAHRCHAALACALDVPVPHIFDAVATYLAKGCYGAVGLLGTAHTLEDAALIGRTAGDRAIVRLPGYQQNQIDELILHRLTLGVVDAPGRAILDDAIVALTAAGADAVILACTELPLLLRMPSNADSGTAEIVDAVDLHVRLICDLIMSETV